MRLDTYINQAEAGNRKAFARRCGVPNSTVNRIADEEVCCRIDTALAIIQASQERPAPSGEVVTFLDLVPRRTLRRARRRA